MRQRQAVEGPDVQAKRSGFEPTETKGRTNMAVPTEESLGVAAIRPFTIEIPDAELEALRGARPPPQRGGVGGAGRGQVGAGSHPRAARPPQEAEYQTRRNRFLPPLSLSGCLITYPAVPLTAKLTCGG